MFSTTGCILLLIALLEWFSYGESCCPYFKDGRFNDTARRLNRGSNCREPFTENGVSFYSGAQWCDLYAGRAFCKWKCMSDCNMNPVREIVCSKVDCGRYARDPKEISISCSCVHSNGRKCETRQYCWQDVEYYHEKYCGRGR